MRSSVHRDGFVAAYKEAFGGPPYNEEYTTDQVLEEVWYPHLDNGLVMIVTDEKRNGKLVGFGCALPFRKSPDDVKEFLEGLKAGGHLPDQFDHRSSWYMSELGVLNEYRGNGAAYELVLQRMRSMDHFGADQYFMRTAAENSLSKPMYLKIGSQELSVLQDVSNTDQVVEKHSASHQRVYLWGDSRKATANIERIREEQGYLPFLPPFDLSPEPLEADGEDEPAA